MNQHRLTVSCEVLSSRSPGPFFFGTNRLGLAPIQFQRACCCGRRVLHPPRRSLELRILVDRQYPMENIAVDHRVALQADAGGMDCSRQAAVDRHALRNDVAIELCAMADQNICGAQLALDATEDMQCALAVNFSDNRHAWAEGGDCFPCRWCCRRLCNARVLWLRHRPIGLCFTRWRGWRL